MKKLIYNIMNDRVQGPQMRVIKFVFFLLSLGYGLAVRIIQGLYQTGILPQRQLNKPVISVGNITVGGAGKTPLIEYLAAQLKAAGRRPVILTRGYQPVKSLSSRGAQLQNDETVMLKESLEDVPVLVGKDRYKIAQSCLKRQNADVFLLDDGYQHWRLKRDLDILVIDAMNPFGNGCLIPRGILREPLSALSRAGIFVISKSDFGPGQLGNIKENLNNRNPQAFVMEAVHQPVFLNQLRPVEQLTELDFLKGKEVVAFCSIGNPESFRMSLSALGAKIKSQKFFMDHHAYCRQDIESLNQIQEHAQTNILVTTQKDAVKLRDFLHLFNSRIFLFSLKIQIKFNQSENEFLDRIFHISGR